MKEEQFAKLFQVGDKQVLVTKTFEDDGTFGIKQETSLENVKPALIAGFEDEESRDGAFEKYEQELAENFIQTIEGLLIGG